MQLVNTHRKCMKCKSVTLDLSKAQCSCGGFMYPIGDVYQPKLETKEMDISTRNMKSDGYKQIGA